MVTCVRQLEVSFFNFPFKKQILRASCKFQRVFTVLSVIIYLIKNVTVYYVGVCLEFLAVKKRKRSEKYKFTFEYKSQISIFATIISQSAL